jgi:cephalosporin-C deacetylase-like acetyl esterase
MKYSLVIILFLIFSVNITGQHNTDYQVFDFKSDTLQNSYFLNRLSKQFDLRREEFNNHLISEQKFYERREVISRWYKNIVGTLPPKTDLNITITKKQDFEDYSIEWVAFESQPNHHVTGLFYLPKNTKPPYPAVYIPCGHSYLGKGSDAYQRAARLFAMNGFAVLQADPISQGERLQYLDENGKPITAERMLMHEILGQHLMLTGSNTLIHELWENIRALDFLEQHPQVDKNKLAVAGNSGGGTQALYLSGYDSRIKTAVISCYLSTTENKLNTIGSQDGCQQLWGEGKIGIEEQDFLMMAAPIPIAILSATEDFFDKEGAKIAFDELKRIYTILGVPEKVEHIFAEGKHGWQKPLREEAVKWCKKWLMNDNSPVIEPEEIGYFKSTEELSVTATGQVLTHFENEKSVSDIIRERLVKCESSRNEYLKNSTHNETILKIKELIGFDEIQKELKYTFVESFRFNNYNAKKYLIERDKDFKFSLPSILIIPDDNKDCNTVTIFVSEEGKADININSYALSELNNGNAVLLLDLSNTGELKDLRKPHYDNKEFWIAKLPLYEGKTLLSYRVEDILLAKRFVELYSKKKLNNVNLVSFGFIGPATLHAAAIDGSFSSVKIYNSIRSWQNVASLNYSSDQLGNIVPGVLNFYDLPDLIKFAPATKFEIIEDKIKNY